MIITKDYKEGKQNTTTVQINRLSVDHKNHHDKTNTRVQKYFQRQCEYIKTLKR